MHKSAKCPLATRALQSRLALSPPVRLPAARSSSAGRGFGDPEPSRTGMPLSSFGERLLRERPVTFAVPAQALQAQTGCHLPQTSGQKILRPYGTPPHLLFLETRSGRWDHSACLADFALQNSACLTSTAFTPHDMGTEIIAGMGAHSIAWTVWTWQSCAVHAFADDD